MFIDLLPFVSGIGALSVYLAPTITRSPIKLNVLYMGRVKRIWYLSPVRTAKVQASLCTRAVLPGRKGKNPLLAHTSSKSRGTFRQKTRSLAPLIGWTCAVKICQDGMLEDTNSLDAPQLCQLHMCFRSSSFAGQSFYSSYSSNTILLRHSIESDIDSSSEN